MSNIYVSDPCPFTSAANLDDPMVATQILYVSRILSTVADLEGKTIFLTEPVHKDDPYVRWCRNMCKNRNWMLAYCYGLLAEYEDRFNCDHHFTTPMNSLIIQYDYQKPSGNDFLNRSSFAHYLKDPIEAYRCELTDMWNKRYRNQPRRWPIGRLPKWYNVELKNADTFLRH